MKTYLSITTTAAQDFKSRLRRVVMGNWLRVTGTFRAGPERPCGTFEISFCPLEVERVVAIVWKSRLRRAVIHNCHSCAGLQRWNTIVSLCLFVVVSKSCVELLLYSCVFTVKPSGLCRRPVGCGYGTSVERLRGSEGIHNNGQPLLHLFSPIVYASRFPPRPFEPRSLRGTKPHGRCCL